MISIKGLCQGDLINYSKWNKPSSSSDSPLSLSPPPALRTDLLNNQQHKQHHAHAPFQVPQDKASPLLEKDPSTDGPKEPTSPKDQPSPQSPTLKLLNNQPPNAAHATPAPTLQPQLPKEPDITILPEASPLLSPSNGQNQETPLPNQLERHRDNLPKKPATCPTTTQSNQVADALPYALEPLFDQDDEKIDTHL
jgi:hypothetical protein